MTLIIVPLIDSECDIINFFLCFQIGIDNFEIFQNLIILSLS